MRYTSFIYISKRITSRVTLQQKAVKVHGGRHPEIVESFKKFFALSNQLMEHLKFEGSRAFPLIKNILDKLQKRPEAR